MTLAVNKIKHLFVSVTLCFAVIFSFSSFSNTGKCSDIRQVKSPVTSNKMTRQAHFLWKQKLTRIASSKKYSLFGNAAKQALLKGFPEKTFEGLIKASGRAPLQKALRATKAMHKMRYTHNLSIPELFQLALFIETEVKDKKQRRKKHHRKNYFSRNTTGLPRSIERDPRTGLIFIHLKTHNVCAIGKGQRKMITPSILYSLNHPEIVAHSFSTYRITNELKAAKKLQGLPGLYEVKAVLKRTCKDGRKVYSIMTKLYTGGNLYYYVKNNKKKLTLLERMRFAHNVLVGVESMHKKSYAHRDLGLKNYFIDYVKEGKRKKAIAVVGDLGRAVKSGKTKERGAQGGYSQLAPEAIAYDKLKDDDYFSTDIYALGCAFYRILYSKKAPWYDIHMIENCKIPVDVRIEKAKKSLIDFWQTRTQQHDSKRLPEGVVAFEKLIMKMVDPNPANRGTATEHREAIEKILRDHDRALRK